MNIRWESILVFEVLRMALLQQQYNVVYHIFSTSWHLASNTWPNVYHVSKRFIFTQLFTRNGGIKRLAGMSGYSPDCCLGFCPRPNLNNEPLPGGRPTLRPVGDNAIINQSRVYKVIRRRRRHGRMLNVFIIDFWSRANWICLLYIRTTNKQ